MKDIFSKFKSKKDSSDDEIGMAVQEEHPHKYAVAESTKERIVEKLRGNLIYIIIAFALIVPGLFKLVGFFTEGNAPAVQQTKTIAFDTSSKDNPVPEDSLETLIAQSGEIGVPPNAGQFPENAPPEAPIVTTPVPESVSPEVPVVTTPFAQSAPAEAPIVTTPVPEYVPPEEPIITRPVPEDVPPENAAKEDESRSMLASATPIGGGSASSSGNIKAQQTADEILNNYFEQENKVEQQLNEILSRMDKLEENVQAVSQIEERIIAIENNNQESATQQLQIVQTKLGLLEKGLTELNQKQKAAPTATTQAAVNTGNNAMVQNAAQHAVTVEAVIPGRAWVRNEEGVLMVVQVGDEITGVGKVVRIDAREGTVATATQMFRQ